MTLWSIARSPLMLGADLTQLDAATLALITNDEVLAVNQHSENNRPLFDRDGLVAWIADVPGTGGREKYLAVFNTSDAGAKVPVAWNALFGRGTAVTVRDLWRHRAVDASAAAMRETETFAPELPAHGAGLYRIVAAQP